MLNKGSSRGSYVIKGMKSKVFFTDFALFRSRRVLSYKFVKEKRRNYHHINNINIPKH